MKTLIITSLILLMTIGANTIANAQDAYAKPVSRTEYYGNTLNLGVGLGYYGYVGHSIASFHADYEIDVARSFTLAPFINYYTFQDYYYWGDPRYPYRYYYYRETVIPIGIKGTYYLDKALHLNKKWDVYVAGSLGFILRNTTWEDGYYGQTSVYASTGTLFLDLHAGAEYHISRKVGVFLDLSTGVSTLGLGFHF